jgi:hypothetical protein
MGILRMGILRMGILRMGILRMGILRMHADFTDTREEIRVYPCKSVS